MTLQPKGTQAFGNKNIFVLVSREQDTLDALWASGGRIAAARTQQCSNRPGDPGPARYP